MQSRYRRVLLALIVLLCAAGGLAGRAFAVTFTEFQLPTANSAPDAITMGPDGALWFTEGLSRKIGRITPDGEIVEYQVPTPANTLPGLFGIAAGPDGALWFTDFGNNQIGRITTAGAITGFPIPNSFAGFAPFRITAGPDGALWFTLTVSIGRITTAGEMT